MIIVDGINLTSSDIAALAYGETSVRLADEARSRAARSFEHAVQISSERMVYGRSTGVGANRDIAIGDANAHALALLRSHATSAGPLRSPERIRAMLAVRLNQLAAGGSGAAPDLLDGLVVMLSANALPPVREVGSIGTGDLPALAVTILALLGEVPTSNSLLAPVACGPKDAMPVINSNAAAIGDAAITHASLASLSRSAIAVAALTFAAVDGNPEAFAEVVEQVTPFSGAREVCRSMRRLISPATVPTRIQDPLGLRCMPQVHGAFIDALARLDDVVCRMANAPSENPALLPGHGVAHHGGFHAAYLAQAVDTTVSAAAQSAQLAMARVSVLTEPAFTGLAPFLGAGAAGASGVMACEYVAASALGSLRALTMPTAVQTVTLSRGVEEDASFASHGARQALTAADDYRTVLACELVAAVRALRLRGARLDDLFDDLPQEMADRDLTADIAAAANLLPRLADDAAEPDGCAA
ncbi:aromatic amino acid lyase [Streptomyces phaeochromogenes]|uniref:aromatic amino acid lyase n=1 Tax=Streptomyces phaeochromogenes TaxID=1923 RepID=UPI00367EBC92